MLKIARSENEHKNFIDEWKIPEFKDQPYNLDFAIHETRRKLKELPYRRCRRAGDVTKYIIHEL